MDSLTGMLNNKRSMYAIAIALAVLAGYWLMDPTLTKRKDAPADAWMSQEWWALLGAFLASGAIAYWGVRYAGLA